MLHERRLAPIDFDTLVEQHSGEIFGYLWRMTRDEAEAEDCLQEAFCAPIAPTTGWIETRINARGCIASPRTWR